MLHIILVLVIVGVCLYLLELIPMDATIKTVVRVLVILFAVLYALQSLGVLNGIRL